MSADNEKSARGEPERSLPQQDIEGKGSDPGGAGQIKNVKKPEGKAAEENAVFDAQWKEFIGGSDPLEARKRAQARGVEEFGFSPREPDNPPGGNGNGNGKSSSPVTRDKIDYREPEPVKGPDPEKKSRYGILLGPLVEAIPRLSGSAVKVGNIIAWTLNGKRGESWPSYKFLMEKTGIHNFNVIKAAIDSLEAEGVFLVKRSKGRVSNRYRWNITLSKTDSVERSGEGSTLSKTDSVKEPGKGLNTISLNTSTLSITDSGTLEENIKNTEEGARDPKKGKSKKPPGPSVEAVVEVYHAILPELPKALRPGKGLESAIQARSRENKELQELDGWRRLFQGIRRMPFLMGGKRDFKARLSWIVKRSNYEKILNGDYLEETAPPAAIQDPKAKPAPYRDWKPEPVIKPADPKRVQEILKGTLGNFGKIPEEGGQA